MFRKSVLWSVFSLFVSACNAPEATCQLNRDCVGTQLCFEGVCLEQNDAFVKEASDGGGTGPVDAGPSAEEICRTTPDVPDDAFQDSNCDGIDGNASLSIFVSTSGLDSAAGDRENPVKTLNGAMAVATATGKNIILIASGTYEMPASWAKGVNLHGGYDVKWVRTAALNQRATILAPSSGWKLSGLSAPSVIERVQIRSKDALAESGSSQALRVLDSGSFLKLRHVTLFSGKGAPGKPGAAGAPGLSGVPGDPGASAILGSPQTCPQGGAGAPGEPISTNPGAAIVNAGGRGGAGGCSTEEAKDGSAAVGQMIGRTGAAGGSAGARTGLGTLRCDVVEAGAGVSGVNGSAGAPGKHGTGVGEIDTEGLWAAASDMNGLPGNKGSVGLAGGGGGGGTSLSCLTLVEAGGAGGGGGGGGFPGSGGVGGTAGGASIALTLLKSNVVIEGVELKTDSGGNAGLGGTGGTGGVGGRGGSGGTGVTVNNRRSGNGAAGGNGGNGGKGGDGGNGAGGPSIGIWCQDNSAATVGEGVTYALGSSGWPSSQATFEKQGCP